MPYYAVAKGWCVGVFPSWEQCKSKVNHFSGALYRRFNDCSSAWRFLEVTVPQSIFQKIKRRETLFARNEDGFIEIYTDGACSRNGKLDAKAAIGIFFGDNHPENVSKLVNRRTNIGAEMQAVLEAIHIINTYQLMDVIIFTDCQFIARGVNNWYRGWARNGWKTTKNKPVAYKKEFQFLIRKKFRWNIIFIHVRGHCGIHGNQEADRLAGKALC